MCFSVTADLAVGAALVPVAVMSLREVRQWREVPLAVLPAVFAAHQLIEALVWAQQAGQVSAAVGHVAALAYVFIAFALLPFLLPIGVVLLQPPGAVRRTVPFVVIGVIVAAYLGFAVLVRPMPVVVHPHALEYATGVPYPWVWAVSYVVAIVGSLLTSSHRMVVAFGVLNLVGLTVVAVAYFDGFTSLWCAYAAAASVTVWLYMRSRRRVPAPERVRDEAAVSQSH